MSFPPCVVVDILRSTRSVSTIVCFARTCKAACLLVRSTPLFFEICTARSTYHKHKAWKLPVAIRYKIAGSRAPRAQEDVLGFFKHKYEWFSSDKLPQLLRLMPTVASSIKKLDLDCTGTFLDYESLFSLLGQNIKSLRCIGYHPPPYSYASFLRHMPGLTKLVVDLSSVKSSSIGKLAVLVPSLEYLHFLKTPKYECFCDTMAAQVAKLKHLKTLGYLGCGRDMAHWYDTLAGKMPLSHPLTTLLEPVSRPNELLQLVEKCPKLQCLKLASDFFEDGVAAAKCLSFVVNRCPGLFYIILPYLPGSVPFLDDLPSKARLALDIGSLQASDFGRIDKLGSKVCSLKLDSEGIACSRDKLAAWLEHLDQRFPNLKDGARLVAGIEAEWEAQARPKILEDMKKQFGTVDRYQLPDSSGGFWSLETLAWDLCLISCENTRWTMSVFAGKPSYNQTQKLILTYNQITSQTPDTPLNYTLDLISQCENATTLKFSKCPYRWQGRVWWTIVRTCMRVEEVEFDCSWCISKAFMKETKLYGKATNEILKAFKVWAARPRKPSLRALRLSLWGKEDLALYYLSHFPNLASLDIDGLARPSIEAADELFECIQKLYKFGVSTPDSSSYRETLHHEYVRGHLGYC